MLSARGPRGDAVEPERFGCVAVHSVGAHVFRADGRALLDDVDQCHTVPSAEIVVFLQPGQDVSRLDADVVEPSCVGEFHQRAQRVRGQWVRGHEHRSACSCRIGVQADALPGIHGQGGSLHCVDSRGMRPGQWSVRVGGGRHVGDRRFRDGRADARRTVCRLDTVAIDTAIAPPRNRGARPLPRPRCAVLAERIREDARFDRSMPGRTRRVRIASCASSGDGGAPVRGATAVDPGSRAMFMASADPRGEDSLAEVVEERFACFLRAYVAGPAGLRRRRLGG